MLINILKVINMIMFSISSVLIVNLMLNETKLIGKKLLMLECITMAYLLFLNGYLCVELQFIFILIIFIFDAFMLKKESTLICLIYSVLVALIYCIANVLSIIIIEAIIKTDISIINDNSFYFIIRYALYYFIIFLLVTIIKLRNLSIFRKGKAELKIQVMITVFVILQIIAVISEYFFTFSLINIKRTNYMQLVFYFSTLVTIVIFCYTVSKLIDKEDIIEESDEINIKMKTMNEVMKYSYENQRKINHEHGNNLAILAGYIENKDYDKAKEYINKIIELHKGESNSQICNLKESGLRSLMSYKYSIIERKGIECDLVIDENISNTIILCEDLSTIVAVFVDNAIDAALEAQEPYISITFYKNKDNGELKISVQNTVKSYKIDKDKIFEPGYSTKGYSRGYGLNIVNELVSRYDELILQTEVDKKNMMFIQKLTVKELHKSETVDI